MSPLKEPRFFVFENGRADFPKVRWKNYVTTQTAYEALFVEATEEIAIGEASAIYLHSPHAARRIYQLIPQIKLIAILRHPVDRAFSGFQANWRDGSTQVVDFRQVMTRDKGYVQHGFYTVQLKRYLNLFEPHQLRVYLYEDYQANPIALLKDIFQFLGVDPTYSSDLSYRYNQASFLPQNAFWRRFITHGQLRTLAKSLLPTSFRQLITMRLNRSKAIPKLSLSLEERRDLTEIFREDILQLQDLLGRDLSGWLQ